MAKHDWKKLEKEYLLGEYKSINSFLKDKNISRNKTSNEQTKEWNNKKHQKDIKTTSKTIEKVTEKQAEKTAQQIVDLKSIANDLALNVIKANQQLEQYIIKNKKKVKKIKYSKQDKIEQIQEKEEIEVLNGIIDRQGLKMLTSALKDLSEIIGNDNNKDKNVNNIKDILIKIKEVADNDRN